MSLAIPQLENIDMTMVLDQLPLGISLQDIQGRVTWANSTLEGLLGLAVDEIRGRSWESLPLSRAEHQTGEGELYQVSGTKEGAAEWLSCELAPWSNGGQKEVTVRYYLDITDAENARIKIDRLIQSLRGQVATDHTSGLLNRTAALNKLETQVSRSRRYHNLLSLVLIQMTGPEEALSKPAVMAVSQLLRDQTRWPDIIGRWQESEFLLILPETSAGSAAMLADKIRCQLRELRPGGDGRGGLYSARFGIAEWSKGDDARGLLKKASVALTDQVSSMV